jgi:hypothetical protein
MAGPILNLIRQLRENRMGGGMGFDRPRMFQPMGATQEPSPARVPATRVGRLLRSIGGGTSRQDYMARRRDIMKPLERKTANDAADPDTTYSRLDNSTAVSPEEGRKIFGVAAKSPAMMTGPRQDQEPVQGGVQDLPAPKPTLSRVDQLHQQRNEVLARMEGLGTTGFSGDQDPNLYGSVALNNVYNALTGEIEAEEKRAGEKDRMNSQLSELDGLADAAFESGNWAGFETVVNASSAVPKDAKGGLVAELQPDYRGNARPTVARKVTQILRARDGLAGASPEEQNKVLAGIAYAYRPAIDASLDDASRHKTSISERDRIVREMSIHHNLSNDPKTTEYFWALATAVVRASGGTFTQPQSSWWPWSVTSPQNAAAAPPHP